LQENRLPLDAPLSLSAQVELEQARMAQEKLVSLCSSRDLRRDKGLKQLLYGNAHASRRSLRAATSTMLSAYPNGNFAAVASPGSTTKTKELEAAVADPSLVYRQARRHGCTQGIRELYLDTRCEVPSEDEGLQKTMTAQGLLWTGEVFRRERLAKEPTPQNRRERSSVANRVGSYW
jgi:hypothetical protein